MEDFIRSLYEDFGGTWFILNHEGVVCIPREPYATLFMLYDSPKKWDAWRKREPDADAEYLKTRHIIQRAMLDREGA
jgi:hypothetical protein